VVRDDHERDITGESLEALHHKLLASLIKMRGGFVEQEDGTFKKKGARDIDSLLLPRRETHPLLPYLGIEPLGE
jgi:hypothetical protein